MDFHYLNTLYHSEKQFKHQIRISINNTQQILNTRLCKKQWAYNLIPFKTKNKNAKNLFKQILS